MGDRGATLVEYAMGIALVVVVSIAAISSVERRGEERLQTSDDRITPAVDGQYYSGGGATSSVPPSSSTSTPAVGVHLGPSPSIVVQNDGSKWQATVTFTLLDDSGNGVIGARLDAEFSSGSGQPTAVTCTTSTSSGLCTVQFININDNKSPVTLTALSISGSGFTWTPQSESEGTLSIACSPPLNASCN